MHGVLVPDWPAPANVHARMTTRELAGVSEPPFAHCNLGVRSGDDPYRVACNRQSLRGLLGLPVDPRWLHQVHGIDVVDASYSADEVQADAAVVDHANVVIAIQTADCLPLLLASTDGSVVAGAHAGWRGLAGGVIEATVERMQAPASSILAWLGPAIGPASYEVGDEVRHAFVDRDAQSAAAFVPTRYGHWLCDLYGLARRRRALAGVTAVYGGGFDTLTDTRFYSHRRDARTGRFVSLIWRE